MSEDVKLLSEERLAEIAGDGFGCPCKWCTDIRDLLSHIAALNASIASRADRPDVAEVERLAEAWVSMAAAYGYGEPGAEHRMIMTKAAFLTALRALGDAEWNAADGEIERVAGEIAGDIIKDLTDRRGLRQAWEQIDGDLCAEINDAWASFALIRIHSLCRTPAGG